MFKETRFRSVVRVKKQRVDEWIELTETVMLYELDQWKAKSHLLIANDEYNKNKNL